MGNCMEVLSRQGGEEAEETTRKEERERDAEEEEEREKKRGRMRIKVVLTKEELQWLMEQIKERGGKSLEEVLGEIERGRRKDVSVDLNASWKPSLESIMECPEVPDQMQR